MTSILFWVLAAICNAVMDTLADKAHYDNSWFSKYDEKFWLKTRSWRNKYKNRDIKEGFVYKGVLKPLNNLLDGWHIFQTLMVVCLAISVSIAPYQEMLNTVDQVWLNVMIWIAIYGALWNIPFNIFYNHVLKLKQ